MIRTRIAPSPTGEDLHIGNLYTAYINFIFAKKNTGKFIVRIEDTDRTRLVEGSEERILSTLESYEIRPDESIKIGGDFGPYRQSERLDIYKKYAQELISAKKAYYCTCSKERLAEIREQMQAQKIVPKYDKHCLINQEKIAEKIKDGESYVIRLNVPENQDVAFTDLIRGEVKINTSNLDDQILIKADGFPTYHMAVVVDDHLMKISHVIRAEEWISSTPKHILLYRAFGWELPIFAHLPILRNPDKSKLSKRKNPALPDGRQVWASWYLSEGFLPEAVLNYLSLMGWSHPDEMEIFDREEFIREFTLERVQAVGPVFDIKKLEWMNGQYLMKVQSSKFKVQILDYYKEKNLDEGIVEKSIPLVRERIKTLKEYWNIAGFLFEAPKSYDKDLTDQKELLQKIAEKLETLDHWQADKIGKSMQELATTLGIGNSKFFMTLRIAITGHKVTPPLNESMEILGQEECIKRIKNIL